ncbi:MAG: cell wall-binding repeat-containing protein [Coriobacteriia bacterium]|nr:cell wall-binding repeat-containing protein [Coriobacteriia bacterium]
MHRARRIIFMSIVLGLVLAMGVAAPASGALVFTGSVLMNQPGYAFTNPQIGGVYVVAARAPFGGPGTSDIVVYNRQTGADASIGYGDGKDQDQPAISGSRVAWIDHTEADGEVWYDDLADANPAQRITMDTRDDTGVRIDGNFIVWVDGLGVGRQIRWYDIERDTDGVVPGTNLPNGITVDRGRVCWYDVDKRAGYDGVYVYDITTGVETVVHEVDHTITEIAADSPTLHGNNVAWAQHPHDDTSNHNVWAANLRTGDVIAVTAEIHNQYYPSLFGDLLAWQDDRTGNENVLAWWGPEWGVLQQVATSAYEEEYPDVFGRTVVYQQDVGEPRVGLSSAPLQATRLAGDNRYETSALISAHRFAASPNVVIATGEDFPDALSASALAGALDCPLLLTLPNAIPADIMAEIDRLDATGAWLVGGTSVISDDVKDQLEDEGLTVQRVSGPDRYATAKQVAYLVMDIVYSSGGTWRKTAFFVRGDAFPDALSVAPHAYRMKIPILLVQPGSVPAPTEEAVTFSSITEGIIVGGTTAVSAATATEIGNMLGDAAERWDGADRYATAVECATRGVARGWLDYDAIGVATGLNFPDALSGGAACGSYGSPLVLTAPTYVPTSVDAFFTQRRYDFGGMTVFGGTAAIAGGTFTGLNSYLN